MRGRAVTLIALLAAVAAGLLVGCGGSVAARTPQLTVVPRVGLVDAALRIVVSNLSPGERVSLITRTEAGAGRWLSRVVFVARADGTVNLARQAPVSGSYRGVSAMGPFWSELSRGSGPQTGAENRSVMTAVTSPGHQASVTVIQRYESPGVRTTQQTLKQEGFVGEFFAPATATHDGPAVVLWGGSEGGNSGIPMAQLLASHGIPALSLAYFDEPGLPCSLSDIPIEYFVRAIRWFQRQPDVDPRRVWGWGVSRGSEALGLVAAHWPRLLHGIIDESASSVVNLAYPGQCQPPSAAAWTLDHQPVNYDTEFGVAGLDPYLAGPATIPLGRFRGPALLISGSEDAIWPSRRYEDIIMGELASDAAAHVHLNYPHAGHADLWSPYTPIVLNFGGGSHRGGTLAGNAAAEQQDWPALLRFIHDH